MFPENTIFFSGKKKTSVLSSYGRWLFLKYIKNNRINIKLQRNFLFVLGRENVKTYFFCKITCYMKSHRLEIFSGSDSLKIDLLSWKSFLFFPLVKYSLSAKIDHLLQSNLLSEQSLADLPFKGCLLKFNYKFKN